MAILETLIWAVTQNSLQVLLPTIVTNKARNANRKPPSRFVRVIVAPLLRISEISKSLEAHIHHDNRGRIRCLLRFHQDSQV